MSSTVTTNWREANQRCLMAELAVVRERLKQHAARTYEEGAELKPALATAGQSFQEAIRAMPSPSALERLCSIFGLSPFEREVLLACAGVELDSTFASLCATVQRDPRRSYPTFSLALAVFSDAEWHALAPTSPLRRWRLIEVGTGDTLTMSPLRVDERVLHYLTGVSYLDARLHGLVELQVLPTQVPPSHQGLSQRIADYVSQSQQALPGPLINLCGHEPIGKRAIAAVACAALGIQLHVLRAADIPSAYTEREALARLWEREAALSTSALLVDVEESEPTHAVLRFIQNMQGVLFVTSREPLQVQSKSGIQSRPSIRIDVAKPSATEQHSLWEEALGSLAPRLNGKLDALVSQFNLGIQGIHAASEYVLEGLAEGQEETLGPMLWEACRIQARSRLDDLAPRIEVAATWKDLVLPEPQCQILREIAIHLRQRFTVYEQWGFAGKSSRGLGISALFSGASGTGKTMAAEVLAHELRLDLYRIDLSQVVSKYIGETEKNLRRVFDAAEEGGAILLFDEADALFGKRSEVKDSHDRYANIEVSYLLQRMEAYRGLAILTTNMKNAIDTAFLRRIRFIVQFPFPDVPQRAEIWRRIFPSNTPTEDLDVNKLARLSLAGGNIRNIALTAAFLAADVGEPVRMTHLLRAARSEYAKLEKPLAEAECRGWV